MCIRDREQVQKNNGILLDGICIQTPDEAVSPTIYLNSFYEAYQNGQPLTSIYQEILNLYHRRGPFSALDIQLFQNFSYLKDKIIFRLIHASSNQTLLKTVPHIPYLDLAIVFCIYLTDDSSTQMCIRDRILVLADILFSYLCIAGMGGVKVIIKASDQRDFPV